MQPPLWKWVRTSPKDFCITPWTFISPLPCTILRSSCFHSGFSMISRIRSKIKLFLVVEPRNFFLKKDELGKSVKSRVIWWRFRQWYPVWADLRTIGARMGRKSAQTGYRHASVLQCSQRVRTESGLVQKTSVSLGEHLSRLCLDPFWDLHFLTSWIHWLGMRQCNGDWINS